MHLYLLYNNKCDIYKMCIKLKGKVWFCVNSPILASLSEQCKYSSYIHFPDREMYS